MFNRELKIVNYVFSSPKPKSESLASGYMLVLVFKVMKTFPKICKKVDNGGDFLLGINEISLKAIDIST